jgi:activator of 2-hydroxyglutaryl-CoA dehydratase
MIHAQQSGACPSDIIFGLCLALARNFLSDTGKIGGIKPPVVFQGGVARNQAMVKAFTEVLGIEPFIPNQPELSGAMGAALIQIRNIKHNVSTVSSCIS